MAFSATEAAFEGFRLVRRNPLALVAWTVLYALISFAALLAMAPVLEQLIGWQERAEALEHSMGPELDAFWTLMSDFGAIMMQLAWLIPVAMIVEAMLLTAVARGVIRPKNGGLGYLGLGMDEVRVLIVTFVLGVLMTLLWVAGFVAVMTLAVALREAVGGFAGLIGLVGFIALVCLMIWLAVRLSLAVPITVAERRFAFFDSFKVTKGRFWPLFGMAIIAIVMVLIVNLLSWVISMPIGVMSGIETSSWGGNPDPEDLRMMLDVTNPWAIAGVIVDSIVKALTVGVLYAPFSAAYLGIKGVQEPSAEG